MDWFGKIRYTPDDKPTISAEIKTETLIKKSVVSAEFSNLHINIDYDPKKTRVVSQLQQKYMAQKTVESTVLLTEWMKQVFVLLLCSKRTGPV